jgi:hypothetical protein
MRSIEKKIENEKARADMAAAVAAYRGPITRCPPGVARGLLPVKVDYEVIAAKQKEGPR